MPAKRGSRMRNRVGALMALALIPHYAVSMNDAELNVAISPDIPPYVMDEAKRGLEIDIVRRALHGHRLSFVQMPYEELQNAIVERRADVSVGVQAADDGAYYSDNFITFANFAISKRAEGLAIESVADLAGHRVLTWQNADLELGDEFEELFSPQGDQRRNYIEVADQEEQVRQFWQEDGALVVIDRSIFEHFSREMGHSLDEVDYHALFPPVTHFKVAFREPEARDAFNRGISELCRTGAYEELLREYQIHLAATICDGPS